MKQVNGKPKRWHWILCLGMIGAGLLLLTPVFPEELGNRLSQVLVVSGFLVLLVLWRRKEKYEDLPLEKQKELDREDRDERNQMIYEKTAWRCWQGETVLFVLAYLVLALFADKISFLAHVNYRIFSWILLAYWVRLLLFELVRWWMNRKY